MKRKTYLTVAFLAGIAAAPVACSQSAGDGGGDTSDSADTSGDDFAAATGGGSSSDDSSVIPGLGAGGQDGGSVPLTGAQLDQIRSDECDGTSMEVENIPAIIQVVLDISLSMDDPAPNTNRTKWEVTREAVLDAFDTMPASIALGLQAFPTADGVRDRSNPGCVDESGRIPVDKLGPTGSAQRQALADYINGTELYLGTPTYDGYTVGREFGLDAYQGGGERFMLLITDGAPTQLGGCGPLTGQGEAVDTSPILEAIGEAAADGVRTFIIGSPGSEEGRAGDMRQWLSAGAVLGGTALEGCTVNGPDFCHFDMTQATDFSRALSDGLAAITAEVADACKFRVPGTGDLDHSRTTVTVEWGDGSADLLLNDSNGNCTEGWEWISERELRLCPTSCGSVTNDSGASVSVSLDCDPAGVVSVIK